jgi:predicted helicase
MTSILPDVNCLIATLHFPLRRYDTEKQKSTKDRPLLIDTETESNLSDRVIQKASQIYKKPISDEEFFYYCYGILSSNEYRDRFQDSLSKMLPHIPLAKDFDVFMKAGRALAQLHTEYETVKPYPLLQEGPSELIQEKNPYHVTKMKIDKKDQSVLIYNARITLKGIPPEAYAFKISGRSPLEWVVDQYQITTDKDSGLTDDPNDWCVEHQDPMYILNLVKRSITVAVESLKIIGNLPPIEERPVKWS